MPYTYKSLVFVWLIALGLFALTATGTVAGSWLLPFILVALATPALILRHQQTVGRVATARERPRLGADAFDQSPLDPGGSDVYRWENEGGARRKRASSDSR